MTVRDCTDRDCGNNPRRKVNPRDYDSVMGFICDRCTDDANRERCPVCDEAKDEHGEPYPCKWDDQDEEC